MSRSIRISAGLLIAFVAVVGSSWAYAAKPRAPKLPEELRLSAEPGKQIYKAKSGGYAEGQFAVYVPNAYSADTPMPLVFSSHGAGGNGPGEMGEWEPLAEQYGFLVVCPSYACAAAGGTDEDKVAQIRQDAAMLDEVLRRVLGSFNVDRKHVMHTGFSGGGNPTYYLAMIHPEVFTAICFRSANYHGTKFFMTRDLAAWRDRPVYIFWGDQDHDLIIKPTPGHDPEGPAGLLFLQQIGCRNLKHEVLPGGGHASRADLAAKWFAKEVVPAVEKPKKPRRPSAASSG
jgi:poly(3-hydroxybutyrate) depolymerase